MGNLHKINDIKKKADELKKPLAVVDLGIVKDGIVFFYYDCGELKYYPYDNVEQGIEDEIKRLEKTL